MQNVKSSFADTAGMTKTIYKWFKQFPNGWAADEDEETAEVLQHQESKRMLKE